MMGLFSFLNDDLFAIFGDLITSDKAEKPENQRSEHGFKDFDKKMKAMKGFDLDAELDAMSSQSLIDNSKSMPPKVKK